MIEVTPIKSKNYCFFEVRKNHKLLCTAFCNHVQDSEEFTEFDVSYESTDNSFMFQHSALLDGSKSYEEALKEEIKDKVEQLIKIFDIDGSK